MAPPVVTILDPLTWTHGWSYDVERDLLAQRGVKLAVPSDLEERDRLVTSADVVISSSLVQVDGDLIATFDRCVGILCYSAGMDAVDIGAAKAAGVAVSNVNPGTDDVADHAMALVLAVHRLILPMTSATEAGKWDLREYPEIWKTPRLSGQVMGVVGAGRIGRAVAVRARAFGMHTVATYHIPPTDPDPTLPHVDLDELMERSDTIVLCASLTPDSRRMIDDAALSRVKPGSMLVNVGRGGLIDEDALERALEDGRLRAAALDVRDPEPPEQPDRFAGRDDVIQTPHMAGASRRARSSIHELAAQAVIRLLEDSGRL